MAPKSYRDALQPNDPKRQGDFILPPKSRNIIPIIAPQVKATELSPVKPVKSPAARKPANDNQRKPEIILYTNGSNSASTVESSLDIFARNYVPAWLVAVNESYTSFHQSPTFPTLDFESYLATLVGGDFAKEVSPVNLSPAPPDAPILHEELQSWNYISYWNSRLQREFALQRKQTENFALYKHDLIWRKDGAGYKALHVPGLRENAPRIDIGDEVHIRELYTLSSPGQDNELKAWYNHSNGYAAGMPCPGFARVLHNPRVWEINRAKEIIVLRTDSIVTESVKCNATFLVQDSKLEPLFRAVKNVGRGNAWLERILFPQEIQSVMQTTLSQARFDIEWFDDLNWEQKKAVHSVVSANYGSVPYLISGPPGTGKTKTLVEIALQLVQKPGHVLICAPSDAAADTLALRLSHHLNPNELFRLNSWTRTFAEVPDRLLLYTYSGGTAFTLPPVERMLSFRIIVTTCRDADLLNRARLTNSALSGLFSGVQRLFNVDAPRLPLHWSALLLDEAAQATEPDVLIPMNVVMSPDDEEFPRFIAAGDQYQLGPKILSKSSLNKSLFQRLFERSFYASHPLSRQNGAKPLTSAMLPLARPAFTNLVRNYRSHPAILSVPSSLFYNDTLIPERKTSAATLSWPGWPSSNNWPVLFCQNSSPDRYESISHGDGAGAGALFNPGETALAFDLTVSLLRDDRLPQSQVMIMTPYRSQVSHLRTHFRQYSLHEVNIGPLEAFQGLESRIVIICTTRTSLGKPPKLPAHHVLIDKSLGLGIIDEPQRLNVAMTRAQEGLIVIGNAACLTSTRDTSWLNFLDFCKRNGCFRVPDGYVWPDLSGMYPQGRLEKALLYKADAEKMSASPDEETGNGSGKRKRRGGFGLKGPKLGMDDEMWQFKELAMMEDSEDVDLVFENGLGTEEEGEEDELDYEDDDNGNGEVEINHLIVERGYDRDLKQEFHRDCVTQ